MIQAQKAPTSFICGSCAANVPVASPVGATLVCENCKATYNWDNGILVLTPEGSVEDFPDSVYGLLAEKSSTLPSGVRTRMPSSQL